MNKKIILLTFLVLVFFAGIIALTQELDFFLPDYEAEETDEIAIEWLKPARWYRSNAGGMALEEVMSRLAALRNEYALAVIFAHDDELPEFLFPYYESDYKLEIRALYKKGEQIRTQWLFKDSNGITRLNAVFLENQILNEVHVTDKIAETLYETEVDETEINEIEIEIEIENNIAKIGLVVDNRSGFIEIFNENSVLITEYRFFEDGNKNKTEYEVIDDLLINSIFYVYEEKKEYIKAYTDFMRYNRSLSLRSIERVFHIDTQIAYNQLYITFKSSLMDSAKTDSFISERLNLYPEFFGDVYFFADSRMVTDTDDKSRIIRQTLYDDEGEVIWFIVNTWKDGRIISTIKTENDTVLTAEYQYNNAGDIIIERNLKNGNLERLVRLEGKKEIEELYFNNVLVLRAEWEDGILISETRVRN